jgi:hypothetical protein
LVVLPAAAAPEEEVELRGVRLRGEGDDLRRLGDGEEEEEARPPRSPLRGLLGVGVPPARRRSLPAVDGLLFSRGLHLPGVIGPW